MKYTTDLTDTQWELIEEFFETKKAKTYKNTTKETL